jgi:hypothetical protein
LTLLFEGHPSSFGFLKNKSIKDNASIHLDKKYVFNIDLKDFFLSIDQPRIWKCLQYYPFNLNNSTSSRFYLQDSYSNSVITAYLQSKKNNSSDQELNKSGSNINNRLQIAGLIAGICCTNIEVERRVDKEIIKINKPVLPQGAPTSPILSNIVCQKLDSLLTKLAGKYNMTYSRYADDITFSSNINLFQKDSKFLAELYSKIEGENFLINNNKTRVQGNGYRKEVTGLIINSHLNVQKRYIKEIRMWIYYWERYGKYKAEKFYSERYMIRRKVSLGKILRGKLNYLKMIKGKDDKVYKSMAIRYAKIDKYFKCNVI